MRMYCAAHTHTHTHAKENTILFISVVYGFVLQQSLFVCVCVFVCVVRVFVCVFVLISNFTAKNKLTNFFMPEILHA